MRRRIHPAAAVGGAAVLGTGALYLTGLLLTAEEAPTGTSVLGVDIGGLEQGEARQKLDRELRAVTTAPIDVTVGDGTDRVAPAAAGFRVDTEETAADATRSGKGPFTVIGNLFASDGGPVDPVVRIDEDRTRQAVQDLADKHDRTVREGSVTFDKSAPKAVPARTGLSLNVDESVDLLRDAYLAPEPETITLPVRESAPRVSAAETERAMREFARPALSAPIILTTDEGRITLTPATLSKHLSMRPDGKNRLQPELDGKGLFKDPAVAAAVDAVTTEPKDATLRLDGDRVTVATDGVPGQKVTSEALTKAVVPLLTESGAARTAEVATVKKQPTLTRAKLPELGLTEKVSSFTANFEKAAYRTKNIGRAAELINGSTVMPGETWSFNDTVGERTTENGFVDGIIILNDKYTKASGGGVSTVATAMFNAIFFAGVKPVEYGAHSFYIERYPEGREATVAWGSLDLKFANDSGKALHILTSSTDTSITVTFLGTKKYDSVEASKGPRTNIKEPGTRPGAQKDCQPQTPLEGFDVTVERIFRNDGVEVKREPFHTRYTPRDEVTCD
ncbi:VanW family protein [Streptomyces sp. NPDC059578]|uniref:VanW family protein n=1 Tax=Streptomyces sp. NPDC059578 TaxID=3346874 RepID=UPI0036CAB00A